MSPAEFAKGFFVNLFVLLAFVALCGMVVGCSIRARHIVRTWHTGLLFGILAVVAMLFPVVTPPGMIFDCRSGVLGAAGLLGGPLAALAGLPLPAPRRGRGALPGLLEVVLPALLGSLCHLDLWPGQAEPACPSRAPPSALPSALPPEGGERIIEPYFATHSPTTTLSPSWLTRTTPTSRREGSARHWCRIGALSSFPRPDQPWPRHCPLPRGILTVWPSFS